MNATGGWGLICSRWKLRPDKAQPAAVGLLFLVVRNVIWYSVHKNIGNQRGIKLLKKLFERLSGLQFRIIDFVAIFFLLALLFLLFVFSEVALSQAEFSSISNQNATKSEEDAITKSLEIDLLNNPLDPNNNLKESGENQRCSYIGEAMQGGVCATLEPHSLIINQKDSSSNHSWEAAIIHCSSISENGYRDWYLPDSDELDMMYMNREIIGGFSAKYYWSSTEISEKDAWAQNFDEHAPVFRKTGKYRVRCVRRM